LLAITIPCDFVTALTKVVLAYLDLYNR